MKTFRSLLAYLISLRDTFRNWGEELLKLSVIAIILIWVASIWTFLLKDQIDEAFVAGFPQWAFYALFYIILWVTLPALGMLLLARILRRPYAFKP